MSSGTPTRGVSVWLSRMSRMAGGTFFAPPSVTMSPGLMTLQRMPCLPYIVAT